MFERFAVIPLDVPPIPVQLEEFRAYVHSHCEQCAFRGNQIRLILVHARKPIVRGRMVMQACDPRMQELTERTRFEWDPVFAARFAELCSWAERLPFARLGNMCIVTQTADIREHMDIFGDNNSATYFERYRHVEPHFYRGILTDSPRARKESFYVTESYGGSKRYVRLPRSTNLFAMSSSGCYHGADHIAGSFKSTLVFYGELDRERHHQLLARSIKRYVRHAVRLQRVGPVAGPAMERPYQGAE